MSMNRIQLEEFHFYMIMNILLLYNNIFHVLSMNLLCKIQRAHTL